MNGNRHETHVRINDDKEHLWASENIDMKVFNERTNTVSTTTTLNSKYDPMTSLATSPTPSYSLENGAKSAINSNNLVKKCSRKGNDNLSETCPADKKIKTDAGTLSKEEQKRFSAY
ncbi:hypothetical protein PVAND_012429 [Polypedilum vanderplanki]|uniref:Uncharacterized protein n=1 Tax=Polypedilum vanderplanki TaxID=319348 RepID=A0A9J6CLK6_POLVA|nr:hypothetical protein PVAND_012429 [Polypedilum vanderplanki]